MNDREKLIELIGNTYVNIPPQIYRAVVDDTAAAVIADHLLANGVRVAEDTNVPSKWIPVTEWLPEEHDSIFAKIYGTDGWTSSMFRKVSKEVLVCIEYEDGSKKVTMIRTKDGQWAQTTVFRGTVTHWMPLPEPPKECE